VRCAFGRLAGARFGKSDGLGFAELAGQGCLVPIADRWSSSGKSPRRSGPIKCGGFLRAGPPLNNRRLRAANAAWQVRWIEAEFEHRRQGGGIGVCGWAREGAAGGIEHLQGAAVRDRIGSAIRAAAIGSAWASSWWAAWPDPGGPSWS